MQLLASKIENGEFDLVAVGRSVMADRAWVKKISSGHHDDIVPFERKLVMEAISDWDSDVIEDAMKDGGGIVRGAKTFLAKFSILA